MSRDVSGISQGLETGKGLRKEPVRPFSQALSPGLFPKLRNFPESWPEIKPELALEVTQNIGDPYRMEDNTTQGCGARSAPPPWEATEGGALLSSIW